MQIRYWVEPLDDPDALGDYGGYTFATRAEAEDFVKGYYVDERRLIEEGYYEPDHEIPLLVIETLRLRDRQIIEADE